MTRPYSNPIINSVLDDMKLNNIYSYRGDCPSCGGRKTLTVDQDPVTGRVYYNCYKLDCTLYGTTEDKMDINTARNLARKHREARREPSRPIDIPTYINYGISSEKALEWLSKNNALEAYNSDMYSLYTHVAARRIYVPLYSPNGSLVNMAGRLYEDVYDSRTNKKLPLPKVKVLVKSQQLPPCVVGTGDKLVIVEDFASAASVARVKGCIGYALMGTQFNMKFHLPYITNLSPSNIIVALDKDATVKADKLTKYLTFINSNVRLLPLRQDLKEISCTATLKDLLGV